MTLRKVKARPVNTYFRPSGATASFDANAQAQRSRQVSGALSQLGVVLERGRDADLKEQAADITASANNKARMIAAQYMPQVEEDMRRPETYDQSVEEFMKSETFQSGYKRLEGEIPFKRHREGFMANYEQMMLKRFADGKSRHDYQKLGRESSLAQQGGAQLAGIKGHMAAYDDALTSGVQESDAFTSGLAVAVMSGSEYLEEFGDAKTWTPDQMLRITRAKASLATKNKSEASLTYKLAMETQGRAKQLTAFQNVLVTDGDFLSPEKTVNAQAKIIVLGEGIKTENIIRGLLGKRSVKQLAEGVDLGDNRLIPVEDIKKIQNEEVRLAIGNKDVMRLSQLAMIPGDEPSALTDVFTHVIGTIEQVDPNDPQALQGLLEMADFVKGNLGTERVRNMMSPKDYSIYQMLDGMADLEGLPSAVTRTQEAMAIMAKGPVPTPEDWNPREVVSHAINGLKGDAWFSSNKNDVAQSEVQAMLSPYFPYWKALRLSQDQQKAQVNQLIKQSSWKGMLNGKYLHDRLSALTFSEGGNPYSEDAEGMFDTFKAMALKGIQRTQDGIKDIEITVSPTNPSVLIMRDKGDSGIPIANGVFHINDMINALEATVKTRKEKVLEEREKVEQRRNRPIELPSYGSQAH